MRDKAIRKFSRRDLFRGFISHVRGQDLVDESSGIDPDVLEADKLLKEKKYQEAAELYSVCLDQEPAHVEALRKLGYCRLRQGRFGEARQTWEKLFSIKPGDHFAVLYSGLSHAMENNIDDAVKAWKSFFNIKQPHIQREINLILALHERGDELDPAETVKSVEEAIARQKMK